MKSSSTNESPVLRHPGRWLWIFLIIPVLIGISRLRFDLEVFDLLPPDLPAVEGLKIYQRHFSNARELIITVQSSDSERTEAAARAIAGRLRESTNILANVSWEALWLERPELTAELVAYLWFNQPPAEFDELTNRLTPANAVKTLQSTREQLATSLSPEDIARLSYDPLGLTRLPPRSSEVASPFAQGQQMFGSADGTFRIIIVRARTELRSYRDCQNWLTAIKSIVQSAVSQTESGPGIEIHCTGRPAFVAEIAGGMRHDITFSIFGTAAIIAVLFWLAHRRVKPMLWLLALLALILCSTLGLGGLIFGTINVVSVGFAAILLGLAVDYAVVHYQEALAHPWMSIPQIRHSIAPSIFWAAVTTISAFLVLNFGGLPGLGQLGTLVALGVALSALIMIFEYLPPLFPNRKKPAPEAAISMQADAALAKPVKPWHRRAVFGTTILLIAFAFGVRVIAGYPRVDSTANALRPRNSPAYAALDKIQAYLTQTRAPLWLIYSAKTDTAMAQKLERTEAVLARAESINVLKSFTVPTQLWPRIEFQTANRPLAAQLANNYAALRQAALANGFTESSMALTERIMETWHRASSTTGVYWPTNELSRWILDRVIAVTPTNNFVLGILSPSPTASESDLVNLQKALRQAASSGSENVRAGTEQGIWLSSWELLGTAIFVKVRENLWKVVAPMVILVLLSLWLAFARPMEMALGLTVLILSGFCLLSIMRLAHWSWNLLNLMAIPLILGTGVDYGIFMQLALRRYHGDLTTAYRAVGRALLLCGGTAIAAFASLAWSTNAGMASLGQVCAVGIAGNMLMAVFLLPIWWRTAVRPK